MKKAKLAVIFSLFKYLELIILALVNVLLAAKLGPKEVGYGMPFLLFVTYSNYFNFGGPQAYLKKCSVGNFDNCSLLSKNIVIASFLSAFSAYFIFDVVKDAFLVGLVSITVLIRSYYLARCRVVENLRTINFISIIGSLSLLFLFFLFVNNFSDYLLAWAISNSIVLAFYYLNEKKFTHNLCLGLFSSFRLDEVKSFYSLGIKLSLIGLLSTLLLSMDRLVITLISFDKSDMGAYQFSDTMSMLFYVFITNIHFFFYPKLIKKISHCELFRERYLKFTRFIVFIVPIQLFICYYLGSFVFPLLFPNYNDLQLYVSLSVAIKLVVLSITLSNVVYVALNREYELIMNLVRGVVLVSIPLLFIFFYFDDDIVLVPLTILVSLSFYSLLVRFEKVNR
ncbi:hypothetical protein AB4267_10840 [Vibrio cyclitrophicus]